MVEACGLYLLSTDGVAGAVRGFSRSFSLTASASFCAMTAAGVGGGGALVGSRDLLRPRIRSTIEPTSDVRLRRVSSAS